MKNTRKNQQGFSTLLLLLVFLVLFVLVLIFLFVRNRDNNNKQANKATSSLTTPNTPVTSTQQSTSTNSQSSAKYLEIEEYGVKIVLTKDIEDAYYAIENGYPYLSVKSLEKYSSCNLNKNKSSGSIAAVSRAKIGDDNYGSSWTQADLEKSSKLKVGEYYYWIVLSNGAACSDPTGQNPDAVETAARKAFSAAKIEKL